MLLGGLLLNCVLLDLLLVELLLLLLLLLRLLGRSVVRLLVRLWRLEVGRLGLLGQRLLGRIFVQVRRLPIRPPVHILLLLLPGRLRLLGRVEDWLLFGLGILGGMRHELLLLGL